MKLVKKESENGGYRIYCYVGKKEQVSYWGAPSKSVDHAGRKYLSDRYPVITTKQREEDFKRLYKLLWMEVSEKQMEEMRHALGLQYKKRPYRNYFFISEKDETWNELVKKGLVERGENHPNNDECVYFWLTKEGVEFVTGKKWTDKMYKEL